MAERYESATQAAAQKMLPLPGPPGKSAGGAGSDTLWQVIGGVLSEVDTGLTEIQLNQPVEITGGSGSIPGHPNVVLLVDADAIVEGKLTVNDVTTINADIVGTGALTLDGAFTLESVPIDPTGGSSGDVLTLGAGGTIALAPPSLTSSPPTVTGSRLASPALASLLTALAGLGLIIDSTTT